MTDEIRNEIALLRYAVLAPRISGISDETQSLNSFFLSAATKKYPSHDGTLVSFSPASIERWYYNYKRGGFDALIPKKRFDIGAYRKLDDDLCEQIRYFKKEFPRIPATLIHQKLLEVGAISKGDVSLSTITRYINQLKMEANLSTNKDMRRYEHKHINEVWYADSAVGLRLNANGKKMKTYIIAFIDDHSRYITGVDVFFNDTFVNLMSVMKSAVSQFGKPKVFSFDNGSPYKNKQMELLAARIGTTLNYNLPGTPTSKAKIERWFGTMKQQWLSQVKTSDFNSLDELRSSLKQYVYKYNTTIHSSLNGKTPKDVFFSDPHIIKFFSDQEIEKIFLLELERAVSADSVIKIDTLEYEVPYRYAKQKIKLRYSPDLSDVYVVDKYNGELTKIKILKKNENALIKREPFQFPGGEQSSTIMQDMD
jgi:transposase InsO family protein